MRFLPDCHLDLYKAAQLTRKALGGFMSAFLNQTMYDNRTVFRQKDSYAATAHQYHVHHLGKSARRTRLVVLA
jgi:hypothetical protein